MAEVTERQYQKLAAAVDYQRRVVESAEDGIRAAEVKATKASEDASAASSAAVEADRTLDAARDALVAAEAALAEATVVAGPSPTASVSTGAQDATVKIEEN